MRVSIANVIFGKEEKRAVNKVLDSGFVTPGKKVREFEEKMAKVFGKEYGIMVNSGSSANLLALYAIAKPGMEVITPALTFGTVVAPIIQNGLIPKFFDVDLETYQINVDAVETYLKKAPRAPRIFMIPALMGNFPDIERLRRLSKKYKIFFILDSCDTNDSYWNGKPVGAFADLVTSSFYSSHIITTGGGGGIVMTDDEKLKGRLQTLRGWGRASAMT
ncbi:MAG: DegT/DnrJ/EryC1/StrS aminotransferase family protein, partial [bacterium]|nr:DegT/DnrJ/EryC1/StrS aminotransferase family protein [bacterium]